MLWRTKRTTRQEIEEYKARLLSCRQQLIDLGARFFAYKPSAVKERVRLQIMDEIHLCQRKIEKLERKLVKSQDKD